MSKPDEVVSWAGEPVADMSRERLLEVFQDLARRYRTEQREALRQFQVLRAFPKAGTTEPIDLAREESPTTTEKVT